MVKPLICIISDVQNGFGVFFWSGTFPEIPTARWIQTTRPLVLIAWWMSMQLMGVHMEGAQHFLTEQLCHGQHLDKLHGDAGFSWQAGNEVVVCNWKMKSMFPMFSAIDIDTFCKQWIFNILGLQPFNFKTLAGAFAGLVLETGHVYWVESRGDRNRRSHSQPRLICTGENKSLVQTARACLCVFNFQMIYTWI